MILRSPLSITSALLALGLGATALPAKAHAGQEGHGGDPLAAEFVSQGWLLYNHLSTHNDLAPDLTSSDIERLRSVLTTTRVEPVPYELIDEYGAQVEARVLPDPLKPPTPSRPKPLVIQVNRAGIYDHLRHGGDLQRLVLHEYLWILGKDDENYRISGRLRQIQVDRLPSDLKEDICRD